MHFKTIYAACLLAVAGAVNAADDFMPPPGLYRVDTDSQMNTAGGTPVSVQTRENGATGGITRSGSVNGGPSSTQQYQGDGPVTVCVKAGAKEVPAQMVQAGCTSAPAVVSGGVATFKSSCGFGDITTTMRKIDAKTWGSETRIAQKNVGASPQGAAGTLSIVRAGLERAMKEGTPEQRAEARQALAQFEKNKDSFARDVAANAAAAKAAGISPNATMFENVTTSRMTRIADSCGAQR
ncbi:hypothetical protein KW842_00150 [Duganella sp. sic0402]|uniref:hypothetical protein n=1 Tax=Duganella sp. sic0402 TaxID=2854786 RepID=UPI001C47780F|nr:hypothetical protein [Duganella sp. sic0402]MBV7534166.1 hypothetical protein [Duganella sp. sic0402]